MRRLAVSVSALALALVATAAPALAGAPAPEGRWWAVQLHAHTRHSDGYHTVADLIRWAREGGLDALAITDHNTREHLSDPAYHSTPDLTLIPAYEWTETMHGPHGRAAGGAAAERCHISVWGLKPDTPVCDENCHKGDAVATLDGEGVTIGANHPFEPRFPWPDEDFTGVSTMEVWQWQYGYDEAKPGEAPPPLPPDAHVPLDKDFQHDFFVRNSRALALWQRVLARGQHITPVAVGDFHIGSPLQSVVSPCTLIWSRTNTVDDLLANLRAGHVCLVEEPRGPRVELWADADADGAYESLAGDTVPAGALLELRVTGARGQTLSVYDANGQVERHTVPTDPYVEHLPASHTGFYWARLDRERAYNPILSMTGAIYVAR